LIEKAPDIDGAYIKFSDDLKAKTGKVRMAVHVEFDGIPYNGNIVNMGLKNENGSICYIIGMPKSVRKQCNKMPGDMVHVVITRI
jgi:hypothetical protein